MSLGEMHDTISISLSNDLLVQVYLLRVPKAPSHPTTNKSSRFLIFQNSLSYSSSCQHLGRQVQIAPTKISGLQFDKP